MTDQRLIIKELDQLIVMSEMVGKQAARLKKKIAGEVSTSPKKSATLPDEQHLKSIAAKRKDHIKKKVA